MGKLSIDLFSCPDNYGAPGDRVLIPEETLSAIALGCRKTLADLAELGRFVEVFRVEFMDFEDKGWGPVITVRFQDPLGAKTAFSTDYRFIGSGGPFPSAEEITTALHKELPRFIRKHLERGAERLSNARRQLAQAGIES